MLEGRKTAVALEEEELVELQRIIIDRDEKEALKFLKKWSLIKSSAPKRGGSGRIWTLTGRAQWRFSRKVGEPRA